jgi:osmoprotectant transport system ATP-binding protein
MIQVRGVTKRYAALTAVDRASLEIGEGELCVLIGPSGCGKSTLLRLINRLVEADEGLILINGRDNRLGRPEELRRSIGYAIQSVGLFPHLTVFDNVATVPRLLRWGERRIAARVEELLAMIGLDGSYRAKFPAELSGGEAQRVGVARALAADPPLLLMDEPFGSVDPLTRLRLQGEFLQIQRRLAKTVLFVTHDVDEAVRLGDTIAVMQTGRILQAAPPGELIRRPAGPFVTDFLGSEYGLQLLGRCPVRRVLVPGGPADPIRPRVRAEASLKEALSLMIAGGAERLTVEETGGAAIGSIGLAEVLQALTEPS